MSGLEMELGKKEILLVVGSAKFKFKGGNGLKAEERVDKRADKGIAGPTSVEEPQPVKLELKVIGIRNAVA
jgi:hypothetical protein